jgi:hypothetical protein
MDHHYCPEGIGNEPGQSGEGFRPCVMAGFSPATHDFLRRSKRIRVLIWPALARVLARPVMTRGEKPALATFTRLPWATNGLNLPGPG